MSMEGRAEMLLTDETKHIKNHYSKALHWKRSSGSNREKGHGCSTAKADSFSTKMRDFNAPLRAFSNPAS
jgi:hypothetical protein